MNDEIVNYVPRVPKKKVKNPTKTIEHECEGQCPYCLIRMDQYSNHYMLGEGEFGDYCFNNICCMIQYITNQKKLDQTTRELILKKFRLRYLHGCDRSKLFVNGMYLATENFMNYAQFVDKLMR